MGTLGIILAYVDDCNALLALEDVEPFLDKFKHIAEPLGAIMNTEKTRILTSTNDSSTVQHLLASKNIHDHIIASSLHRAISNYSRKPDSNKVLQPYEVTDGLRVLGAPIGSPTFCTNFLLSTLDNAQTDANKIISGLTDIQTKLRIFSTCTVHKLTHLFASDVYNSPISTLPDKWFVWNGSLNNGFTTMINSFLEHITQTSKLPIHSHLIATISTQQGGLGLQHPLRTAIPSAILSTKRCLQFATEGIWLSNNKPLVNLPPAISSLYSDWETSSLTQLVVFRKYLPDFASLCVSETSSDTDASPNNQFIYNTSVKRCRHHIKLHASEAIREILRYEANQNPSLELETRLDGVLDVRTSLALQTMSRQHLANRIKNENFQVAIKCKLRLPL